MKTETIQTFPLPAGLQRMSDVTFSLVQLDQLKNSASIQWRINGTLQEEDLVVNLETGYLKPLKKENVWAKQRWTKLRGHVPHIARHINHRLQQKTKGG